jgi:hypothetical protein
MNNFIKKYGKVVGCFLFIILFLIPQLSLASSGCSPNGYTVLTINGIFTDDTGARNNSIALARKLKTSYNNQPLTVDYLYNPTHGIFVDLLDSANQKYFDENSFDIQDSDFAQMLTDASEKVTTQKILLVGHSQGNFYANTFYDKVADEPGGVPSRSIGVYSVATPSTHVAGGGLYLTSDTDKVISGAVSRAPFSNILKPNAHIDFKDSDDGGMGHDFSKIYLTYQGDRIISDIKTSLNRLQENDEQDAGDPCLSAPNLTLTQKIQGKMLSVVDPISIPVQNAVVYVAEGISNVGIAFAKTTTNLTGSALSAVSSLFSKSANQINNLATNNQVDAIGGFNQASTALSNNSNTIKQNNISQNVSDSNSTPTNTQNIFTIPNSLSNNSPSWSGGGSSFTPDTENVGSSVSNISATSTTPMVPPPITPTLITTTIDQDMTLTPGVYKYDNLVITNNAKLTLEGNPNSASSFKGVEIDAVNITVDSGASISADGQGYGPNSGPGISSRYIDGASYGGLSYGSVTYSNTYGSATKPIDLGSGGSSSGGGAVHFVVSNTFIDNGIISANGNFTSSGGSIYLTANSFVGNGKLIADGGPIYGSGYMQSPGGGGRIAIYYQNSSFSGTIEAKGGCGSYDAWSTYCGDNGTVGVFDQLNNNLYLNNFAWKFLQNDGPFSFKNIYVSNGAQVTSENGVSINANNLSLDKNSTFNLADNQILNTSTITINGGSTLTLPGTEKITADTLTISGNSTITVVPQKILSLTIPNITVDAGSSISADKKGYGLGAGPGAPTSIYDPHNSLPYYAGASYGGIGSSNTATSTYGSANIPIDFGSGGNGNYSAGGGAIQMTVNGTFVNNGTISSNGNSTGSGGSIYIITNNFSGSGTFQANGGGPFCPMNCYGPGGGGRIAIYYQNSLFTGSTVAKGWSGDSGSSTDGTVKVVNGLPDITPPVITALSISPSSGYVKIGDQITLSITADSAGYTAKNISINNIPITNFTDKGNGIYTAVYTVSQGDSDEISGATPASVVLSDASGNSNVAYTTVAQNTLKIDANAPTLVSAKVTSATTIDVTFSEDLNGTTVNKSGNEFTVSGHSVSDAQELNGVVTLTLVTPITTGETPSVTFSSTDFKDLAGNQAVSPATVIATNSVVINSSGGGNSSSSTIFSNDDTLKNLTIDNDTLSPAFSATQISYNVVLPVGTIIIPIVSATTTDSNATETIIQATSTTGSATVTVKAQDGTTTQTYTINFSVAVSSDNTATKLKIITPPQTITVNTPSSVITVEAENNSGTKTNVSQTTDVNLSSSSPGGTFASASASTGICDTDWTKKEITISSGDAHKSFCYEDSVSGTSTITVSVTGLSSDSQTFTVN